MLNIVTDLLFQEMQETPDLIRRYHTDPDYYHKANLFIGALDVASTALINEIGLEEATKITRIILKGFLDGYR